MPTVAHHVHILAIIVIDPFCHAQWLLKKPWSRPCRVCPLTPLPSSSSLPHSSRLENVYLKNLELRDLVELARAAVVSKSRERLLATAVGSNSSASVRLADALPYVVLDLPCSFFMLRTLSDLGLVSRVARSLAFSPELEALGARLAYAVSRAGSAPFNGVHLRIEKDARDWAMIMGGQQVVWKGYVRTMRELGLNETVRLYAASGMLTYGASDDMRRTVAYLRHKRVCSQIHHKEMYIPKRDMESTFCGFFFVGGWLGGLLKGGA